MGRLTYVTLQATSPGQAAYSHVREIIQGLQRRGWDVTLFEVEHGGQGTALGRLVDGLRTQVRALAHLRGSVVYVRWHFLTVFVVMGGRLARRRVVLEVNGAYEDVFVAWPALRRVGWLVRFLMRLQLRLADARICVTQELCDWVAVESGRPSGLALISNGANVDIFNPDAERPPSAPSEYVVFFGALSHWQGLPDLLAAVRQPEWPALTQLIVIGDGALRLDAMDADANERRVTYLGPREQREVASWVANSMASMICKSGDFESTGLMPLKLFESLSAGVPVVVTDFPGMANLVAEHGLGIVVPPNDPGAIARAVRDIRTMGNSITDLKSRARDLAVSHYSWDAKAASTDELLRSIEGLHE